MHLCMNVFVHVYKYTYMYMYMYTHRYMHMHMYIHIYISVIYIYVYTFMYLYIQLHIHVQTVPQGYDVVSPFRPLRMLPGHLEPLGNVPASTLSRPSRLTRSIACSLGAQRAQYWLNQGMWLNRVMDPCII